MALQWSPWIVLDPEHVHQLGPRSTGLYEVKIDQSVVDYPGGKSSMIYYGCTDDEAPTLREALERDWIADDKKEVRDAWSQHGDLVFRFALEQDATAEHNRRMESFIQRFGRAPWANPETGET